MQRPLNADTTRPPSANRRAHQRQVTHCRDECNPARPHEALDRRPPAAGDEPSPGTMPHKRPPREDPDRFEVCDVSANGGIRWHHRWGNVSTTGVGAYVSREAIDESVWHVDCGPLTRDRRLERHRRIEDASGRLTRRR